MTQTYSSTRENIINAYHCHVCAKVVIYRAAERRVNLLPFCMLTAFGICTELQ